MKKTPIWRVLPIAVAVAVAAGLSGCGGASRQPGAATPSTVARSTSSSTSDGTTPVDVAERQHVEEGYRRASDAYVAASATSDPDLPALAETHLDPMLGQRREILRARRLDGRAGRQPQPSQSRIEFDGFEQLDASTARLTVCVVDDGIVFEVATGRVINADVETARDVATMRLDGGVWKLAEREKAQSWPGVAGCATD